MSVSAVGIVTAMEDHVARVVNHPPVSDAEWESIKKIHPHVYADWIREARKHIRALAVPTEEMAFDAVCLGIADDIDCSLIFTAMINAASPPTPPLQEPSTLPVTHK